MLLRTSIAVAGMMAITGAYAQDFPNYSACINSCLQRFSSELATCQTKPLPEKPACESRARANYNSCSIACYSVPYP